MTLVFSGTIMGAIITPGHNKAQPGVSGGWNYGVGGLGHLTVFGFAAHRSWLGGFLGGCFRSDHLLCWCGGGFLSHGVGWCAWCCLLNAVQRGLPLAARLCVLVDVNEVPSGKESAFGRSAWVDEEGKRAVVNI